MIATYEDLFMRDNPMLYRLLTHFALTQMCIGNPNKHECVKLKININKL